MRIAVNDEYVDFEAPVYMTDDRKERFIGFMKGIFPNVEVTSILEKDRFGGERNVDIKKWTVDELFLLAGSERNDELATKMNRTEMSVSMKRSQFFPELFGWAKKKGYTKITKEIVREFLDEEGV